MICVFCFSNRFDRMRPAMSFNVWAFEQRIYLMHIFLHRLEPTYTKFGCSARMVRQHLRQANDSMYVHWFMKTSPEERKSICKWDGLRGRRRIKYDTCENNVAYIFLISVCRYQWFSLWSHQILEWKWNKVLCKQCIINRYIYIHFLQEPTTCSINKIVIIRLILVSYALQ